MFASMIFRKEPFFHGHDNYDQVCAPVAVNVFVFVIVVNPKVICSCRWHVRCDVNGMVW